MPVTRHCVICGKSFLARPIQVRAGQGKYCSISCRKEGQKGAGNPFFGKHHSEESKRKWRETRNMNDSWLTRERHHQWKGGITTNEGYLLRRVSGKKIYLHREEIEKATGRQLSANEIVHHINGDKQQNDPDNLMIVTRGEHAKIHCDERVRDCSGRFCGKEGRFWEPKE